MSEVLVNLQAYNIICPRCAGELIFSNEKLICADCHQDYPVIEGIPDLRIPPVDLDEVTLSMLAIYEEASFEDLISLILRQTRLPQEVIENGHQYYLDQNNRSEKMTAMFLKQVAEKYDPPSRGCALDLGCGSGAGVFALTSRFDQVIGIDASMPQLLLAKKALEKENKNNFILICGNANVMPIQEKSIAYIQAINVLEHLIELTQVMDEISRILEDQGVFAADSRNKYDVFFPEPHTGLRFLGFLPWKFIPKYVEWRCNSQYEKTRLLSYSDLNRYMRKSFSGEYKISFPDVQAYGKAGWIDRWIEFIKKMPIFRSLLIRIFATHIVIGKKSYSI